MAFERIGGEEVWSGKIASVRVERFRYDDGEEAEREVVAHPGAVAVVAHDGEQLYLVRQPREPVGEQALLELPAGKLDEEGEEPLDDGQARAGRGDRQGRARRGSTSRPSTASPGFSDEEMHIYLATDLDDARAEADGERADRDREPCRSTRARRARSPSAGTRRRSIGLLWLRAYELPGRPDSSACSARGSAVAAGERPAHGDDRPPAETRPFEHLVLDFLAYLEFERGLSRNTLEAYRSDLLQFGRFLDARDGRRVDAPARATWRTSSPSWPTGNGNGRRRSPATIHRKAACLRSFYRHLRREGVLRHRPDRHDQRPAPRPPAAARC